MALILDEHREHVPEAALQVDPHPPLAQQQVAGRADGQELRDALDDAEENRFEQVGQRAASAGVWRVGSGGGWPAWSSGTLRRRLTYINPLYTVTAIVVQMHTSRINVAAAM